MDYYTGLLNAVERSVHLHGPFATSGGLSIIMSMIDRCQGKQPIFRL